MKKITAPLFIETIAELEEAKEILKSGILYDTLVHYGDPDDENSYNIPAVFYLNDYGGINHQGVNNDRDDLEQFYRNYQDEISSALPAKVIANPENFPEYFL